MSETKNLNSQEKDPELFDVYELGYHLLPTIAEADVPAKVEEIKKFLESFGAEFISEEEPKLINLAYTMIVPRGGHNDKYDTAYFGWIKFEVEKSKVPEIQKELKLNQDILRFILFKTVKEDTRANIDLPELKETETDAQDSTPSIADSEENFEKVSTEKESSTDELDKQIESITS